MEKVSVGTLLSLAHDNEVLLTILGSKSERSQAIRLGKSLKANRNRRFDGYIVKVSWASHGKQNRWQLCPVADEDGADEDGDILDLFGPRDVARDVAPSAGCARDVQNSTSRATDVGVKPFFDDCGMSRDVNSTLAGARAQTGGRAQDA